ncbi:hypothetical protein Tco_1478633 [Tanacetum coccineum]
MRVERRKLWRWRVISTNKTKITRKPSKNGQTRARERKSTKCKAKARKSQKVNYGSTEGEMSLKHSHWPFLTRRTHVDSEENTQGSGICSQLCPKETQGVSITDCHAGNPCELPSDLTANNELPMIGRLYGLDKRSMRCKQVPRRFLGML